ncbi:hypothetical protein [Marmoricola sp. RAF53]|uniref:hypothetical protein n=1 Tax=Marmoricola sp. RAF53 TaxID=3233059 RepID=UPI003F97AC3C
MTDGTSAPGQPAPEQRPPGWAPPPPPPPSYAAPTYAAPAPYAPYGAPPPAAPYGAPPPYGHPGFPPLHQTRPVYKPGTIPLKPLGLGDMFSGAIETIRRNPKATLGLSAVVLTGFLLIPTLATLVWGWLAGFGSELATSGTGADFAPQDVGMTVTALSGAVLSALATIVVTGMIVHVVENGARGQKLSAGAAWRLTRRRVWRLLGLAIVSFLFPLLVVWVPVGLLVAAAFVLSTTAGWIAVVVGVPAGMATMVFLYIRTVPLAPAVLVLEGRGVFASLARSWELTRRQFWRTFGIVLLTQLLVAVAGQILSFPFGILQVVALLVWPDTNLGIMVALLASNLALVVAGSLTTPFSAGVAAFQYLDQRIRKEGYDIELISQLAVPAAPSGTR